MANKQNLELHQGDSWDFRLDAHAEDGGEVDDPKAVDFVVTGPSGVVHQASLGSGVTVEGGEILIAVPEETTKNITPGLYAYQARIRTQTDTVSTQSFGAIRVRRDLFQVPG